MNYADDKDSKLCQCVLGSFSQLSHELQRCSLHLQKADIPCHNLKKRHLSSYTLFNHTNTSLFFLVSRKIFCSCCIRMTMPSKSRLSLQQTDEHLIWMWHTSIAIAQSTTSSLYIPWVFAVIIQQYYFQQ